MSCYANSGLQWIWHECIILDMNSCFKSCTHKYCIIYVDETYLLLDEILYKYNWGKRAQLYVGAMTYKSDIRNG